VPLLQTSSSFPPSLQIHTPGGVEPSRKSVLAIESDQKLQVRIMPADGIRAAANKGTSARFDWQLAKKLHHFQRCYNVLADHLPGSG
jgi:hypothetical protein